MVVILFELLFTSQTLAKLIKSLAGSHFHNLKQNLTQHFSKKSNTVFDFEILGNVHLCAFVHSLRILVYFVLWPQVDFGGFSVGTQRLFTVASRYHLVINVAETFLLLLNIY